MTTDPYPFTDEGLRDALAKLGRRRQKVRRTLVKHGCQGDPDQCNSCPVAVYLSRLFGTDDVTVESGWACLTRELLVDEDLGYGRYYLTIEHARAPLPPAVVLFTRSFDCLRYPELIKVHPKEPPV